MPAVSIVIPMYNAENFIGECLDSILNQTFTDFEVIVVDDCSTDNSVEIVKGYTKKFGGRLKLAVTEKNSGGGGYVPRNVGLELARGDYIFFADADDFIVETALEIFHAAATQSNAEVVYTSRYYLYDSDRKFRTTMDLASLSIKEKCLEDKPAMTIDDAEKNYQQLFFENAIYHMPWTKFVARKFLTKNKIEFPQIISGGDFIWTIQVLYCSKRFLRLPIALYFYRDNAPDSVTRKKRTLNEQVSAFLMGAEALRDLSKKIPPLRKNPRYLFEALKLFLLNCLGRTFEERMQLDTQTIYEILHRDMPDSTIPFFFSVIDAQQKELLKLQQRIAELEKI